MAVSDGTVSSTLVITPHLIHRMQVIRLRARAVFSKFCSDGKVKLDDVPKMVRLFSTTLPGDMRTTAYPPLRAHCGGYYTRKA